MEERFADSALRLAALAAQSLGWTPDIFWNATPAELAACLGSSEAQAASLTRAEVMALIESDNDG